MKILNTCAKNDGFFMPAEFSPHYGTIVIWAERSDSWQYGGYKAREAFAKVINAIAKDEKVIVLCSFQQYDNARKMLDSSVKIVEMSTDDAWARDVCPTFVVDGKGGIRGNDWGFNAWGGLVDGLYFPWDKDNRVARKVCDLLDIDCYNKRDFILEGGSIHSDGEGTIITTKACLLSEGRNPQLSQAEIEQKLCENLGAEKVIWLENGIYNDETNEHIDNICAFVKPAEVVLAWTDDQTDPQYKMSKSCLDILENSVDAKGRKIKVHKLILPKPITITKQECDGLDLCDGEPTRTEGERLAGSYVNFYISNNSIILPAFGVPQDEQAKKTILEIFPERKIVQIYARDILIGGGNIHCITQQIPQYNK